MPTTVEGKTIRLACNQSSNDGAIDKWSGESLVIWQGATAQIRCTLFDREPAEDSLVTDFTGVVSATLYIRKHNARGTVLLAKTILLAAMDTNVTWNDYVTDADEHFTFSLSASDTNQLVNDAGVLPIYFSVKVITSASSYVAAFGYGKVIDVGIVNVAPPSPPNFINLYTDVDGIVQNVGPITFSGTLTAANLAGVNTGDMMPAFITTFGGVGDGTTSNDAMFTRANASNEPVIYLGPGTFKTSLVANQITRKFIGTGTIVTQNDVVNSSPGNFTWLSTRPTVYDWSKVQAEKFVLEQVRNGLDEPYFYLPTTPHSIVFDNRAGAGGVVAHLVAQANIGAISIVVNSTVGFSVGRVIAFGINGTGSERVTITAINAGTNTITFTPALGAVHLSGIAVTDAARTMQQAYYIGATHRAGGDMYGTTYRIIGEHGALPGQTHVFQNSTVGMWGGDINLTANGLYGTPFEIQITDNGYDVGVITPISLSRNNATGALGAVWIGLSLQSQGSQAIDVGYSLSGKARIGLDFQRANFSSNGGCAIGLAQDQYVYYDNTYTLNAGESLVGNVLGGTKTGFSSERQCYEVWVKGVRPLAVFENSAFFGSETGVGATLSLYGNSGSPGLLIGAPSSGTYIAVGIHQTTGRGFLNIQDSANTNAALPIDVISSSFTVSGTITGSNLSGSNTGDQTITLTGDVTGSGTGSFVATVANSAVTLVKMANIATASLIYRKTAGTGVPEVNSLATLKTDLGLTGTNTGDQVVPSNTTLNASQWFSAYDALTGTFTKSQPTFTDLAAHPTTISGYGITDTYTKSETNSAISSAVVGLLDDRGNYNASGNVFPSSGGSGSAGAILKGDLWTISVAGTLNGIAVTTGDVLRALIDTPGQTGANWVVTENNLGYVPVNAAGTLSLAGFASITGTLPAVNVAILNQNTTGSAATLTTPRAIYGNNFDGSTALTQIIASTYGGTGNGFTKFSGPATNEKTKTLSNASDTILELAGSYTPTGTWTSLTMVTPVLGTPASGVVTNLTGTASININGTVGATTPTTGAFTSETFSLSSKSTTALATPSALSATQYTAFASTVSGASIMGYGTTNDVSLMNRAGTVVLGVGPNTTLVNVPGTLSVGAGSAITSSGAGGALGTAAFTASSAYATSTQGTTADNAMPKAGGTFTGDILFTDASYDIGKSAATRPRDLFLSRNATIGGTLTLSGNQSFPSGKGVSFVGASTPGNYGVAFVNEGVKFPLRIALDNDSSSHRYFQIGYYSTNVDTGTWTTSFEIDGYTGNVIHYGLLRLKGYTVSGLPSATQGDTAFVTDALAPTFLSVVVGGGAVVTPVFYNGSSWVGF